MGWFSSAPAAPPPPKPSNDGGFIAPDRSARAHCWEGRDAFFKCLDRNNVVDSVKDDAKARAECGKELEGFEKNCASSWVCGNKVLSRRSSSTSSRSFGRMLILFQVQYFKKRRVMEYQRELTLRQLDQEGAQPMDDSTAGGAGAAALKGGK